MKCYRGERLDIRKTSKSAAEELIPCIAGQLVALVEFIDVYDVYRA